MRKCILKGQSRREELYTSEKRKMERGNGSWDEGMVGGGYTEVKLVEKYIRKEQE